MSAEATRPSHDEIERYLLELADRMRLGNYTIPLSTEVADDECLADTFLYDDKRGGRVRLGPTFHDEPPAGQRLTLVHELIHIVCGFSHLMPGVLADTLGSAAYEPFAKMYDRAREVETDHLARVIAPFMPMPPWAEK